MCRFWFECFRSASVPLATSRIFLTGLYCRVRSSRGTTDFSSLRHSRGGLICVLGVSRSGSKATLFTHFCSMLMRRGPIAVQIRFLIFGCTMDYLQAWGGDWDFWSLERGLGFLSRTSVCIVKSFRSCRDRLFCSLQVSDHKVIGLDGEVFCFSFSFELR